MKDLVTFINNQLVCENNSQTVKIDFTTEEAEFLKDVLREYERYFEIEDKDELKMIKDIQNKLL